MKRCFTLVSVTTVFVGFSLLFPIKVNAVPINYGDNIQSSISATAEIDTYTFTANAGDVVTILFSASANTVFGFTGRIEIYNSAGSLLKRVDGNTTRIDMTLAQGTYIIWITEQSQSHTGNYGLGLYRLKPVMGATINYGDNKHSDISAPAELDSYLFTGSPNDVITILFSASANTVFGFSGHIEIYKPDGSLLKAADGNTLRIDTTLHSCGIYTIWVLEQSQSHTGNYGLSINQLIAGAACAPTPVTWLYFKGQQEGNNIQLTWATASEQNSKEFIVERSEDNVSFMTIGRIKAAGNSNQISHYQYTDEHAAEQTIHERYYRLKQVDLDEKFMLSSVVKISIAQNNSQPFVQAYPNPFTQSITLQLNEPALGPNNNVTLYSAEGKVVYQHSINNNSTTVSLTDLPVLTNGMYVLKAVVNGKMLTTKLYRKE